VENTNNRGGAKMTQSDIDKLKINSQIQYQSDYSAHEKLAKGWDRNYNCIITVLSVDNKSVKLSTPWQSFPETFPLTVLLNNKQYKLLD
jgi:hypothetical protein